MTEGFYPVQHQLLVLSYSRPYGSHGTKSEEWHWDVFSVVINDLTLIRCECTSSGRNEKISWFKSEEVNVGPVIKEKCLNIMKKKI